MSLMVSVLPRLVGGVILLLLLTQVHGADEITPKTRELSFFLGQQWSRPPPGIGLIHTGSTLGFGTEVTAPVSPKLKVRFGLNDLYDRERSVRNEIRQSFDLRLRHASFMLDWHPFGGSFRTSFGVFINDGGLDASAVPMQVFSPGIIELPQIDLRSIDLTRVDLSDIDLSQIPGLDLSDIDLSAVGLNRFDLNNVELPERIDLRRFTIRGSDLLRASGTARFNRIAPYFGIGWGNATRADRRLHYSFDLGVVYHGSPDVELEVHGSVADFLREQAPQQLDAFLSREEQELEAELEDDLKLFPFVSFGLSYSF